MAKNESATSGHAMPVLAATGVEGRSNCAKYTNSRG